MKTVRHCVPLSNICYHWFDVNVPHPLSKAELQLIFNLLVDSFSEIFELIAR